MWIYILQFSIRRLDISCQLCIEVGGGGDEFQEWTMWCKVSQGGLLKQSQRTTNLRESGLLILKLH